MMRHNQFVPLCLLENRIGCMYHSICFDRYEHSEKLSDIICGCKQSE